MQIPNVPSPAQTQNMTGNAFFPANDDFLLQQLQQQIDFYFSAENLCRDEYLRSLLYQNNGAVPVEVIASFPMIKKIVARAFFGPAVFQTDPLTLPPADCNLLRHAVALNSHTVMVEGMFFVHPEFRVHQHYPTTPFPQTTPQGRFAPVGNPHMDRHTSPLPTYEPMKKVAGDDASTRTLSTVSPTSFTSTLNPSADENDDHKAYITVEGIPDNLHESILKKWLAFHERPIPKGLAPVFPVSLEKILPRTWKLSFYLESEARTAMEIISQRTFKKSGALTCEFVGGGSPSAAPVAMMYQPFLLPHGEQVFYATAYPQSVLETAQKGMVALPYSPSPATPMYAWAYSPSSVTPAATPSAAGVNVYDTQDVFTCASSPQEETKNVPPPPTVYQPTPDPHARQKTYHRSRKSGFHNKNRKSKMDEFPSLAENSETNVEKNGDGGKTALLEQSMGKMKLNKDTKKEETNE